MSCQDRADTKLRLLQVEYSQSWAFKSKVKQWTSLLGPNRWLRQAEEEQIHVAKRPCLSSYPNQENNAPPYRMNTIP